MIGTPLPAADVILAGDAVDAVADRIAAVGPDGTASPHVRVVAEHAGDGLVLHVTGNADGYRITRPDGSRLCTDVAPGENGAAQVVDRLEHIERWHQVRRLENPRSSLAEKVSLWLATGGPEEAAPADIATLRARRVEPDHNGVIPLELRTTTRQRPPERLRRHRAQRGS